MTILGIAVLIGILLSVSIMLFLSRENIKLSVIKVILILSTVFIISLSVELVYYNYTPKGKRSLKTQESELYQGIPRKLEVYSINGNLIKEYTGTFDIDDSDSSNYRILFDDEKGLRHIIYYSTSTVIIDEIEK